VGNVEAKAGALHHGLFDLRGHVNRLPAAASFPKGTASMFRLLTQNQKGRKRLALAAFDGFALRQPTTRGRRLARVNV
jgi:hypothetical protein